MNHCSSALDQQNMALSQSRFHLMHMLPQWHVFMCRARWLVTPQPTDAGSIVVESNGHRWSGPVKALLWMVIAIGTGLLIANLAG